MTEQKPLKPLPATGVDTTMQLCPFQKNHRKKFKNRIKLFVRMPVRSHIRTGFEDISKCILRSFLIPPLFTKIQGKS